MNKQLCLYTFILLAATAVAQDGKKIVYDKTRLFIKALEKGNFKGATSDFDSTISRIMDAEKLETTWFTLTGQYGDASFGETSIDTIPNIWFSQTPVLFSKAKMELTISYNARFEVAGFHIRARQSYSPPDYVNTMSFVERKLSFGDKPYVVNGTLTIPFKAGKPQEQRYPVVIMVGGSGPTDRDMSYADNKSYKDIAWGLACKNIAVFRYDKRTYSYGAYLASDAQAGKKITIKEEYLDDVKTIVAQLKQQDVVDTNNIFILGHSEGGMLAPLMAKENKSVKGLVLLAANVSSIQELMLQQLHFLYDSVALSPREQEQIDMMRRQAVNSLPGHLKKSTPEDSVLTGNKAYWLSLNAYSPAKTAASLNRPILVLQGGRDYQVPPAELEKWKQALKSCIRCNYRTFPKLNHLFLEGEGKPNNLEYSKKSNVPLYVVDEIAGWIRQVAEN